MKHLKNLYASTLNIYWSTNHRLIVVGAIGVAFIVGLGVYAVGVTGEFIFIIVGVYAVGVLDGDEKVIAGDETFFDKFDSIKVPTSITFDENPISNTGCVLPCDSFIKVIYGKTIIG